MGASSGALHLLTHTPAGPRRPPCALDQEKLQLGKNWSRRHSNGQTALFFFFFLTTNKLCVEISILKSHRRK